MSPAQPLVDFDLDSKPIFLTQHRPDEEDKSSLDNLDGEVLRCTENCGETMFAMEAFLNKHTEESKGSGDVEVDIIEGSYANGVKLANSEDPNATEYSSSFGNTVSRNGNCSEYSEAEVESQLYGDNDLASFDPFGGMFQARKKKLTSHWRNFVRPLMWRCKWAELRIKEIEAQASKYSKELAAYDQRKKSGLDQFLLEDFGSKSLPFTSQYYKKKAMKRRKRKRVEDTTDMSSYISHHNLFAYLDNKRSDLDATSAADDFSNPVCTDQYISGTDEFGANNERSLLEFKDDDDNSLEHALWKIEMLHSRVHKLKRQIDMVMSKNASKFSSSENLSLLATGDTQTSSRHSPTFSAGHGDAISMGALYSPTQHIPKHDTGDLVMPESGISSHREAIPVPDVIESTGGLLSGADVTLHEPQIGDSCEDIMDNVVVHNKIAEAEKQTSKSTSNQPVLVKHEEAEEAGKQGESTKPDSVAGVGTSADQSNLTSSLASEFHVPTSKRKRGERKGGSGGWRRRSGSGEPDSQ